jgi:2-hydroxychromene-2-carboxylate isomerase
LRRWAHGEAPGVAFDALAARFGVADPQALIADAVIKQTLNDNTARALARGVYGVPTFDVGGELFWGLDAMPLLSAYLANPQLFASGELRRAGDIPVAQARKSTT